MKKSLIHLFSDHPIFEEQEIYDLFEPLGIDVKVLHHLPSHRMVEFKSHDDLLLALAANIIRVDNPGIVGIPELKEYVVCQ